MIGTLAKLIVHCFILQRRIKLPFISNVNLIFYPTSVGLGLKAEENKVCTQKQFHILHYNHDRSS